MGGFPSSIASDATLLSHVDDADSKTAASIAPYPFDSPHAEVILHSSDGVNFRVWKVVLARVSPVFKSMFTLPTPQTEASQRHGSGDTDCQIVSMTEDAQAIRVLLRLC